MIHKEFHPYIVVGGLVELTKSRFDEEALLKHKQIIYR
jgi:hypothetical protein